MRKSICAALATMLLTSSNFALAEEVVATTKSEPAPQVEEYILAGKLTTGEVALKQRLQSAHDDQQARFGLGMLQFLKAIERLGQDLHHYGMHDYSKHWIIGSPWQWPVPPTTEPKTINYQQLHALVETFRSNLVQSEQTLSAINGPEIKLPLHFGLIRLDLNGDGRADEAESLWRIYAQVTNNRQMTVENSQQFVICFDRGDVHWLRGYCHLLASLCEVYLAYDTHEVFEHCAHLLFARVDSPYPFLSVSQNTRRLGPSQLEVLPMLDIIAMVHLIRCNVVAPERMHVALHHLEAVIIQSRESWKWIMAETDDDREWLPNPRQTGVIPNATVTEEMVTSWMEIMKECDKLLSGKVLIPFWRGDAAVGINLRKVFLEPRMFDLVLWIQGTAATPYLEKGEISKVDTWTRLSHSFGGRFPGFALWFN